MQHAVAGTGTNAEGPRRDPCHSGLRSRMHSLTRCATRLPPRLGSPPGRRASRNATAPQHPTVPASPRGEMQTTITLRKLAFGTDLHIEQDGVPDVIPAEACYLGWQESLTLLVTLVEAEIPDSA